MVSHIHSVGLPLCASTGLLGFPSCFVHLQARDESLMANASVRIGF